MEKGDTPELVSQGSCRNIKMILAEVSISYMPESVVAFPLAQFSCCALTMPVR